MEEWSYVDDRDLQNCPQNPPKTRSLLTEPDREGHRHTDSSRFVRMLPLMAASLFAMATPATTGPCPAGVVNQLDGLYRWHVQSQWGRVDRIKALSSQRQRFTPSLFELLLRARKLQPIPDGRFIDFDVFSNTQAETIGAKVTGCSAQKASNIQAEVSVEFGRRGISSGIPNRLFYEMNKGSRGNWRINNISYFYSGKPSFQLRQYLMNLLNPAP